MNKLDTNRSAAARLRSASSRAASEAEVAVQLAAELAGTDASLILYFASNAYNFAALAPQMKAAFGTVPCVGCTTAGELSALGYASGSVVAIAFPAQHFHVDIRMIENLHAQSVSDCMRAVRSLALPEPGPGRSRQGILLVDGMSLQEDALIAAIDSALHGLPVMGGSSGDGLDFQRTIIAHDTTVASDCAVLCMLETDYRMHDLIFDHFEPTATRMVVTGADPARRLITEINAEPAAAEYAYRIKRPEDKLTPFDFASHPLLARAGDRYHVRAIQERTESGGLKLMSAIDQGVVLTLGRAQDIVEGLQHELGHLSGKPEMILAFDCILRRLDAERLDKAAAVSEIFSQHNMVGFNTYGEQHHGMHVNQTFVGIAFYPPETAA